jgi:hypothetical protein
MYEQQIISRREYTEGVKVSFRPNSSGLWGWYQYYLIPNGIAMIRLEREVGAMLYERRCKTPIRSIFTAVNEAVKNRTIYTQPSFPTPIASKLLPLRVRLSCSTGTASRLMSFSDGGGDPSTQPFQPFFTATLFFRGCGGEIGLEGSKSSSS